MDLGIWEQGLIKTNKHNFGQVDVFGPHNFEAGNSKIMVDYNHVTIRIIS